MCKHGTHVEMELLCAAKISHTGQDRQKLTKIDACIAPIVKALNDAGIVTEGSCCGHGKADGWIVLSDGRWLRIGVVPPDQFEAGEGDFLDVLAHAYYCEYGIDGEEICICGATPPETGDGS